TSDADGGASGGPWRADVHSHQRVRRSGHRDHRIPRQRLRARQWGADPHERRPAVAADRVPDHHPPAAHRQSNQHLHRPPAAPPPSSNVPEAPTTGLLVGFGGAALLGAAWYTNRRRRREPGGQATAI